VTVIDPAAVLTGIAVTTPPTKTVYVIGEDFDPAGMVVTATYDDGLTREVPHADLAFSGFDSASAGQRTVTVTYRGMTATVAVSVVDGTAEPTYGISLRGCLTSASFQQQSDKSQGCHLQ